MSDTKFTPGPWRIDDCGDVRSIEDGEVIAVVLSDTDEFKTANLIAAAPELYSVLNDALSALRYIRERYGSLSGVGFDRVDENGLSALAKACGEAV